jgi:ferredoxin
MDIPDGLSATPVVWRVRVNRQRCQDHARCVALAPELFELDEFGDGRTCVARGGFQSDSDLGETGRTRNPPT